MRIDILTIFPQIFQSYTKESIIKRAQRKKLLKLVIHDIRNYATDKHKTVDDRPYGGGPGMILKVEPIYRCLKQIKKLRKSRVILLTPAGKIFNQKMAKQLSRLDQLIMISGRYEGFDDRVKVLADLEISIGEYVLTGGELPAMVLLDAITRHLSGVLGNKSSLEDETFAKGKEYLEYPQYTRPADFKGMKVPKILFSGNHKKIAEWREKHRKKSLSLRKVWT